MEELKEKVTSLTPDEWDLFFMWVLRDEKGRREAAAVAAQQLLQFVESGLIELTSEYGAEEDESVPAWVNPKGETTAMYPRGAEVTRYSKRYVSVHEGLNGWEPKPGSDVWQEKVEEVAE